MSAVAFDLTNPNFAGPSRAGDLLAREVLAEQFAGHGLVTPAVEERIASEWERGNGRALLRTWEEAEGANHPHYAARAAALGSHAPRKLNMDPGIALEEIDRLERGANPAESAARINELRTEVLGLEPKAFGEEAIGPQLVRPDQVTPEEQKLKEFFALDFKGQQAAVRVSTDLDFLDHARHGPRKRVHPMTRKLAGERIAELKGAK